MKGVKAFFEDLADFERAKKKGMASTFYEWADSKLSYRVGLLLPSRIKNGEIAPIFYYTNNMHDAKFLVVKANLYGNPARNQGLKDVIHVAEKIERATRLQKIVKLMAFAKEKRFFQMNQFQYLTTHMFDVAKQSIELKRTLAVKWFGTILDNSGQTLLISPFRKDDPKKPKLNAEAWRKIVQDEPIVRHSFKVLTRLLKNR